MYLSKLIAKNFRLFGSEENGNHLELDFNSGLNVLIGENDSGKTAIIDAIRHVLWTTSLDIRWLTEEDFHIEKDKEEPEPTLSITCIFRGLSEAEQGRYLEYLSIDNEEPCLYVSLMATRRTKDKKKGRNIAVVYRTGKKGDGPRIEGEVREFLKTTYLKPLRDAEKELAAGRGSRLSQILAAYPEFESQDDESEPDTLVGIMKIAEQQISDNAVIKKANKELNEKYLEEITISSDKLESEIGIAKKANLRQILEKLDLRLKPPEGILKDIPRGLGFNNALFMATELLLLGDDDALPLLMIEEPEAHLHPQMQYRLMDFLEKKAANVENPVQIIITTHSPNLASNVDLEKSIILNKGNAFSLRHECTELKPADYQFLRRFLDVTKSNLFFAKGVVIVEGDAESILLPTLAELLGRSFSENGVSIVNVGSTGLFRYSRIFQRKTGNKMPVLVACIADRDIVPDEAKGYVKTQKYENDFQPEEINELKSKLSQNDDWPSGHVRTFISDKWTFEYDLALFGLAEEVYIAVRRAMRAKNKRDSLDQAELNEYMKKAQDQINEWKEEGKSKEEIAALVYKPLKQDRASKAETAYYLAKYLSLNKNDYCYDKLEERLPKYIIDAIEYVTDSENG